MHEPSSRDWMIEEIEAIVGCWGAVWHEWPIDDIRKLYGFVVQHSQGDLG